MNAQPRALALGGESQEFSFHRVDLGEICCDVVIAAALPGIKWKPRRANAAAGPAPHR
jgi:hypothetical protein